MGSFLVNGITDGSSRLTIMTKLFKQELSSDAEEEGLVPTLPGRDTSMQKVPSVSDLSDPESSLGESLLYNQRLNISNCSLSQNITFKEHNFARKQLRLL